MKDNYASLPRKAKWQPPISFWVTTAIWALLLILMALAGRFGIWLVLFALFGILSALYSLVSGRRSWLGLPRRKAAGVAVGASFGVLVLGVVVAAAAMPALQEASLSASDSTTTTAPATPTAAHESLLRTECTTEGETDEGVDGVYVCTPENSGQLVWMIEETSKTLLAERAATAKAESDAAATNAARETAAAQKAVAERAAADEAARVAAAQSAADKAARVAAAKSAADKAAADARAAEQAPVQQAPVAPVAEVPDASAYYPNCAAARAAGAAPMYAGQPGYRPGLDRDKDGIACDK